MPAINQEINVIINALVRKLQDVRELNKEINALKSNNGAPVVIDEKLSKNAKASAGDVAQLQTSIDRLSKAIEKLDDQKVGKLAKAFQLLSNVSNILGHAKGTFEGIQFVLGLGDKFPAFGQKLSQAGTAVRSFFAAAREKGANALATVKESVTSLTAGLPRFTSGALGAAGGLAAIGTTAAVAGLALGGILAIVLALVAVPAIVGILFSLAKGASDAGSSFHDLSQETAVSVETLSALKPAADQSSSSIEEVAKGISKFNKLIGEAAGGSKEATRELKRFGLEPQEALKNNEAALARVFKRIHELPTPIEKAIAAQRAFGKSGAALVPVIEAVGGNLDKAKEKARQFGLLLNDQAAKEADEFGDQLDELRLRSEGFANSIGRVLIPELLKLLRIMGTELPQAGGAFKAVLEVIGAVARYVTNQIILLVAAAKTLKDVPAAIALGVATGNTAVATTVLDQSFAKNVNDLLAVANTPLDAGKPGPSLDLSGSPKGTKRNTTPADVSDSEFDLRAAGAQQQFDREKRLIDELTAIYKTALDARKIATEDFFANTEKLRRREIENQITLNRELTKIEEGRLAAEQKRIKADKETTPAQKKALDEIAQNKFATRVAPLTTELEQLTAALEALPGLTEAAERAALDTLENQINDFLAKVDEANGRTAHAAAEAIDREFKDLLERVTIEQGPNSSLVKLIKEFIQLQKDRARVQQIDQQLVPLGQTFERDRLEIETKVARQILTQREGRRQINALQRKYLEDQLVILKHELAATSEAAKQLEIKLRIAGIEKDLAVLDQTIDDTARSINDSLRFAFEDFFASLADGTKSFKEAISDLGTFILQMFARLAAQRLVESLFGSLLGNEQGQGGIGGFLSGLFGGKKAAGDVVTARPGGQFINVAEAGFDEYVVTTDPRYRSRTASLLGNFINRTGIVPNFKNASSRLTAALVPTPRLAMGGLVPAAAGAAPAAAMPAPSDRAVNLKQVLVYDPRHVHDAMRSSGGEDVFLDFVDRNASLIRRRLKL
jgi:hypothetical protein